MINDYSEDHPKRETIIKLILCVDIVTRSQKDSFAFIPYNSLVRRFVIDDNNAGMSEGQLIIKYGLSRAAIRWIIRK
jgi:hypothetical protein